MFQCFGFADLVQPARDIQHVTRQALTLLRSVLPVLAGEHPLDAGLAHTRQLDQPPGFGDHAVFVLVYRGLRGAE